MLSVGVSLAFRIYGSCEKFQESIGSTAEILETLRSVPLFFFFLNNLAFARDR